ncbi:MAG: DUF1467 family protein [Alphaproteobacteria bacterium]|nr:DUF1467 family protein [Alphaproteobacteria bacterium]
MSIVTGIVAFTIIWMVVLFAILPIGVRTAHEEGGEVEQGHAESAPVNPRLGFKFLLTTIVASAIFALVWYLQAYDPLDLAGYFRSPGN